MRYHKIPNETVRRLPIYLRGLLFMSEQGQRSVSSRKLADFIGVNPWQIRKDFSYFGGFGTRGVGYKTGKLAKEISKILKLDAGHKVALVGVGNLGTAVLEYPGFKMYNLNIVAAFDTNAKKIGRKIKNITVENISKLKTLKKRNINLVIIAVPRSAAQKTADALVKAGVRGILNFSPCYITVPRRVKVITVDIAMDFARLPYYIPST